jgi:hypothetical protein
MGSLVNQITALSAAFYGVNILELSPPGGVRGSGTSVVAIVGNLPWGPVDTITEISSPAELYSTFAPLVFGRLDVTYPALRAFINKTFPATIRVVRISPTSQATATRVFDDASSGDSVTVTARSPGLLGNSISVAWTANVLDATARDATVTIGTTYSVTYKAVATIVSTVLVVTDPGDPYVSFAKASGATLVPVAIAATALATGADGTAVAGEYTSAIDLFAGASAIWNVGFVAEIESGLLDTVNAYLKTFEDANKRNMWILSTVASQSVSTAKTYAASYRSDRLMYCWPKVKTVNAYDPDRAEITVDGNSFAAVALASVAPEQSPGGNPGAQFLRGITAIEQDATTAQLKELGEFGITPWFMSDAHEGAILHDAVTTSLTAGLTQVFRRRMTDYLVKSIGDYLQRFVGELLDVDLVNRRLGAVTTPEVGQVRQFLSDLEVNNRIRDYSVDPFGSNTQSNIDAGQFIILVAVKLYSVQRQIVLLAQIGETVDIIEAV